MDEPVARLLELALLALVLPLWLVTGALDAACHRRLHIERSSGTPEARLHVLMLAELGIAVTAALLLEINAAVLAIALAAVVAHEATMWRDLAYADGTRDVPWYEQIVHSVQHALPWVAFGALVLLHPGQALSVVGLGAVPADWQLRPRSPPLPAGYLAAVFTGALLLAIGPILAELRRCRRASMKKGIA